MRKTEGQRLQVADNRLHRRERRKPDRISGVPPRGAKAPRVAPALASLEPPQVERSTPRTSWAWIRPDLLTRVLPMALVPLLYLWISHAPASNFGITLGDWLRAIWLGLAVGVPLGMMSALFRVSVYRYYRWPTPADHSVQTLYYFVVNAPVEELFFRGFVQTLVASFSHNILFGFLVGTLSYGLYHRLGNWSWTSIVGVTVAGAIFGVLYLFEPHPASLLLPIIVHGFATTGFLNGGSELKYRQMLRQARKKGKGWGASTQAPMRQGPFS